MLQLDHERAKQAELMCRQESHAARAERLEHQLGVEQRWRRGVQEWLLTEMKCKVRGQTRQPGLQQFPCRASVPDTAPMHGGLVHDDRAQFVNLSMCALLASQSELERELMALASQPINGSKFLAVNAGSGTLLHAGARIEQRRGDAVVKGGQRD